MMIQILAGRGKASPEERSRIAAAAGTAMMALGIAGLAVLVLIEALGLYSISQHANSYQKEETISLLAKTIEIEETTTKGESNDDTGM